MINLLQTLINSPGISGSEGQTAQLVQRLFAPYCSEIKRDALGNVIGVRKCGKPNAKKVMLEAHMDEIGLIVTKVLAGGFLLFAPMGGVDAKILPACQVVVHGKRDVLGVIGAKPPHLTGGKTGEVNLLDMAIDTGLENAQDVVSVGDLVSFDTGFAMLSDAVCAGRCLDDRAGLAVVLGALEQVKDKQLAFDVYAVAATAEEVGLRGAKTAAYALRPDCAICVDVTHGQSPDAPAGRAFPLGSGPAVSVGPNISPVMFEEMKRLAKEEGICHTVEAEGGDTGTDAWAVQAAPGGVHTMLLSVPLRYMHTTYEVANIKDMENTARLIAAFLTRGVL